MTADIAGRAEIHEMSMTDGMMKMRQLTQGLLISPGRLGEARTRFLSSNVPGPEKAIDGRRDVPSTLTFEKSGTLA